MPALRTFCCAKGCYNFHPSGSSPAFFNLPSDVERRWEWLDNAGRPDLKQKSFSSCSGKYYICADHFESDCFDDPLRRNSLRQDTDVLPTKFENNLASLVGIGSRKSQEVTSDSDNLSEAVKAEPSSQGILDSTVLVDDVLGSSEWTNIVAVSLSNDGNIICDSSLSLSEVVSDATEGVPMECLMLCRLCAALVQISMLVSVFGEDADLSLQEMVERLIPGQVTVDDGLPQRVCTGCVERLRSCCEILDLFKAADTRLRQMIELCKLEEGNVISDVISSEIGHVSDVPVMLQSVAMQSTVIEDNQDLPHSYAKELSCLESTVVPSLGLVPMQANGEEANTNLSEASSSVISTTLQFEPNDAVSEDDTHPFKCVPCEMVFEDRATLLLHCVDYHSSKLEESVSPCKSTPILVEDSVCKKELTVTNDLHLDMLSFERRKQRKLHSDEKLSQELDDKDQLIEEEEAYNCDLCVKVFKTLPALRKHKSTHTGEKTVLCSLCGKTLANLNSLRVHMRIHSEERPFTCPECGKSFKGPSELKSHSVTHSREKIYNCPECGRKFHSKGLVRQHMLSHTHDKPHKCDLCTAAFNRLGNLNQHKKKHASDHLSSSATNFECTTCGKRFQSKLTLKYHHAKHTGDKYPFDCEICGKKFIAIDPYRVHMRVHTGERPFECEVCTKAFRSSATLKQHVASIHRNDFPFACPYCQRSFKRLQSLIVHKKTHTGEKPWLCSQCGRAFAQKGDMIKHTKTHRPHLEEEAIIMEVDNIDDLALDSEISKMIFG